jgi:large subunit ribosomal protein L36
MQVTSSLRSSKRQPGSTIVRRNGQTVAGNKLQPHWNARQG